MGRAKPFDIPKREVWEAYKRVRANQGAAGVDGQSIADFEADLSNNLYKLWNRLSSGSYFPPPVRRVDIPKDDGRTRPLGIPTVADRIAQMVVKRFLEPLVEPQFHEDSYGYRPGKSALDAVGVARQRCWRYDWVLDLDIKSFFDDIDRELLMRAVRKHTDCPWVLLYLERWLRAPVQMADGSLIDRERGTPQGGVVSPLLANLFLHYAFDMWMGRNHPGVPFERYADDAICHCRSEAHYVPIHRRLPLTWPNGARVALWVNPNVEFFGLDDVMPSNLHDRVPRDQAKIPNVRNWAVRDYGNRVGIWRLMEVARFELLVPPKERGRSEDANVWKRWYVFTRHRAATELVLGGRSDAE